MSPILNYSQCPLFKPGLEAVVKFFVPKIMGLKNAKSLAKFFFCCCGMLCHLCHTPEGFNIVFGLGQGCTGRHNGGQPTMSPPSKAAERKPWPKCQPQKIWERAVRVSDPPPTNHPTPRVSVQSWPCIAIGGAFTTHRDASICLKNPGLNHMK